MMVGGEDTNQEAHQSNRETIRWLAGFGLASRDELAPCPDELAQFLEHATASDEDLFAYRRLHK
jgi:hypothetical protein